MAEMLAARLHIPSREVRVEKVPLPEPGPGEVRVEVRAAGVCLSDVHLADGTLTPLLLKGDVVTLGHEVAGVVDALGAGVTDWAVGDRVLLQAGEADRFGTVHTRGVDYDGGYAQLTLATPHSMVPIPDSLPFEQACIIPDAVSTPWAAITATAATRPGDAAAVWGVGGLGAHAVQLLRLVGAAPVIAIDPLPAARKRALGLGADAALDPADPGLRDTVRGLTGGLGVDASFDFAGVGSVREQAMSLLGRGGRLVVVGLANEPLAVPNDLALAYFGQSVRGSYGSHPEHLQQLVKLVVRGRLDLAASISDVLPLAEAPAALDRLARKDGDPIRLVLRP
ncbi:zinc-binding dehydrogenase [Nonomuraea jiangxiensis]|uniref:D-arabinose 1-dehydrogenase, Zn-dependent alcohol dehydrogenase family n=1 Tax=Nonomuraea jiangxiensis TaxID=633440 RepID=A0A1G8SA87_9ACTN|nr:zinc-binding dehydrogenase [Nonomuraea jiangxiensis]SDJ26101.1 D-arabinose 1-dehydrogenase, Zn-dependent alcohol dehydrogenase family [Nonomuraea jiangxiensis]